MLTSIQKWGNSQGIRLPDHLLEEMNWKDNEPLHVKPEGGRLIIEKIAPPKKKTIQELFDGFSEEYPSVQVDWGKPVGVEIW